jgi:hypothetical protein
MSRIDDYEEDLEEDSVTVTPPVNPSSPRLFRRIASAVTPSSRSRSASQQASSSSTPPVVAAPLPPPTNAELMSICRSFLEQLRHGTAPWVVQRLNNTYGPMPTDASRFSFWVALILPIDEHEKAKLLPIRSPRLRLRLVVHWIEQLNNNWWVLKSWFGFGLKILFCILILVLAWLWNGPSVE